MMVCQSWRFKDKDKVSFCQHCCDVPVMAILTPGSLAAFHIWVLMEDAYGGLLGVFNETPSFSKSNHVL